MSDEVDDADLVRSLLFSCYSYNVQYRIAIVTDNEFAQQTSSFLVHMKSSSVVVLRQGSTNITETVFCILDDTD